ncbi:MAG TPA: hypothetical protein VHN14_28270 [Kofleriaceae bacterium]|nr:hypothetical protein [Kofleriaceae bacterium]
MAFRARSDFALHPFSDNEQATLAAAGLAVALGFGRRALAGKNAKASRTAAAMLTLASSAATRPSMM